MTAGASSKDMTAAALQAAHGIAGAIRFRDSELGGLVAEMTSVHGTAVVALQGAQVLSYVPAGGREVLWLSPVAKLGTGRAVRGGIPVCWPWFGPHAIDPSQPAHGLVRASPDWVVQETAKHGEAVRMRFAWHLGVATAGYPAGLFAILDVTLGEVLRLDLTTVNGSGPAIDLSQALHTYLAVGDIGRVSVSGLEGQRYIDQLAPPKDRDGAGRLQTGLVLFDGEVDRVYLSGAAAPPSARLDDPDLARSIIVNTDGSASTVVWNPWIDKAARLGDVGAEGYRRFVCIETANAGPDSRTIASGQSHRLSAIIRSVAG